MALTPPIGSWKVIWFGSSGPFYYDDGANALDPDLLYDGVTPPPQTALITEGQITVASVPILDENALRLVDVGTIVGDVVGPGASTDHAVVRWDGVNGKLVQNSLVIIDDNGKVKLPTAALLSTPVTGMLEFNNNRFYMTNVAHQRSVDRTSDVVVSTVTVENTAVETTVWTGAMSANSLVAGNMFKFHADGVVQNGGPTAADRVTLRVRVAGITLVTLSPIAGSITADSHWHLDANATQRTLGTTGSRAIHLDLSIDGTILELITMGVVDTTANMDVTVTAQWASADVNNIFSLYQAFMEYKN